MTRAARSRLARRLGRAGVALAIALSLAAPACADFQAGLAAYQRGDYASALREWLPVAEAGNATAQLYLGLMYERGHGVPASPAEARRWYERAAATTASAEEKQRATDGMARAARALASAAVDASLVGRWQTSAPDPATGGSLEMLWDIAASGEFSMTVAKKRGDGTLLGRALEKGQFKAKAGQWSYALPSQTVEGTYRVLGPDAFEATGPLGTARWTRIGQKPATPDRPPTAVLPRPSGARVLLEDELRAPGRWPETAGQFCRSSYGDGGYIVDNVASKDPCFLRGFSQPAAVRIELSVRLRSGSETGAFGLGFAGGDGGYFSLAVSAMGQMRLAGSDGSALIPWTASPAVRTGAGQVNRLAVEVQGAAITAYVNGTQIGVAQAPRVAAGDIGMYVGVPGMSVIATELRVTELGASTAVPAPRVAYDEDFRTPRTLPLALDCRTAYQDGGLSVEVAGGMCSYVLPGSPAHDGDVRLELTVDLRRGASAGPDRDIYGLEFGLAPDGSYYVLEVGTRGFVRLARWDGTFRDVIPWRESSAVKTGVGAVNQLAVAIQGRTVRVFVNGVEVASAQAPTPVAGRFGVWLNSTGMRAVVSRARMLAPATAGPR